ncbi:MAG: alpha/beta hydrolase [Parerythrobacter sp.]
MSFAARLLSLICAALAFAAAPAHAQMLSVETWMEEWNPATQRWVRIDPNAPRSADRFVSTARIPARRAIARYGPFHVINAHRAALMDVTDAASPAHFRAMLRDYPQMATLALVEAPGTQDDRGNLAVGRLIRAAGIATHVPADGSVRSGAVELFLAGKERRIDDGAEFAVHSWIDNTGREAGDYAVDAEANRTYLDYYAEMGMTRAQARSFYAMTNSVPHAQARWMTADDMRGWLPIGKPASVAPRIAFANLDSAPLLP